MKTTTFTTIADAKKALETVRKNESEARKDKESRIPDTDANKRLKACKAERRAVVTACRAMGMVLTDSGVLYSDGNGVALTHVAEKRIIETTRVAEKYSVSVEDVESFDSGLKLTFKSRRSYVKALDVSIGARFIEDSDNDFDGMETVIKD